MPFINDVKKFFNETTTFKYGPRHRALYEFTNYYINRFTYHKKRWEKEYSKAGDVTEVPYKIIEEGITNLGKNNFCSEKIYEKILLNRDTHKSYHYGYKKDDTSFHFYFFSKKPPSNSFLKKLVITTNVICDDCLDKPKKISILFCDTGFKKMLPDRKEMIGPNEVNSGSTTFIGDERMIHIWRREERIKVYIHELLHAMGVETETIRDVFKVEPFMKHFNVDIPLLLLGEAYVETYATYLNLFVYFVIDRASKPERSEIIDGFNLEVEYSTYQVSKLLYHFGYRFVREIYNKKGVKRDKFVDKWKEDSNVFSYYLIKWGLLSNICKMFEMCDIKNRIPCGVTDLNLDLFIKTLLLSWNKRKFTSVINKHIADMSDKNSRYKYIGKTLRMTVYG